MSSQFSFNAEEKSKELESLLDSISSPIILVEKNFTVKRANLSTKNFLDKDSFQSIIQNKCYSILYKRSSICPYCPFLKDESNYNETNVFEEVFSQNKEINKQIILKSDTKAEVLKLSFFPIYSEKKVTHFVEMITNITSNLEKEEENLKFRNLASLGVMISGIAHELNNPLTGIGFTVQNLLNNLSHINTEFIQNRLNMIKNDLEKASSIVADIMSFSKPEKQKFVLADINSILIKSKESTQRLYPDLSKNIVWDINSESEFVFMFDTSKIERVFTNIFRNSLQAFDYRKGTIRIDIKKKKNSVQISVDDNAGGIDDSIINKIFDPFFTNKKDGTGTGLGLSICYSIIKEHNGKISVKSKDDRTKFIISLPFKTKEIN
jgi:signal transduction histidine kinase